MTDFNIKELKFPGFYRGKVLDNNDSEKLGRLKIDILGISDGEMNTEDLPWAVPAMPISSGAGSGFGTLAIPEEDSYVWVFFEAQNFYQPVYFAEAVSGVHGIPSEIETNYPYRKVIKTKNGIILFIDDLAQEIRAEHPTGAYIKIDIDGNIFLSGTTVHINP